MGIMIIDIFVSRAHQRSRHQRSNPTDLIKVTRIKLICVKKKMAIQNN